MRTRKSGVKDEDEDWGGKHRSETRNGFGSFWNE
jgi:hypothetical protein